MKTLTVSEYMKYIQNLKRRRLDLPGLVSEVTGTAGTQHELMFTATQLKEIFALAGDGVDK